MGLLAGVAGPLGYDLSHRSTGAIALASLASLLVVAVVTNVLKQLLSRNPREPPVVFHWLPFFGSTVVYGIDPYKFFFRCREKVWGYFVLFSFPQVGRSWAG